MRAIIRCFGTVNTENTRLFIFKSLIFFRLKIKQNQPKNRKKHILSTIFSSLFDIFIMQLSDFNFNLPDELIARYPLETRSASRLLHLDTQGQYHDITLPIF